MNRYAFIVSILALLWASSAGASGQPAAKAKAKQDSYQQTIAFYKKAPQAAPFFRNSYAYAVFPAVGKGAFIIGGAFGHGKMFRQGRVTGTISQAHFSLGMQVGGQAFSQIIFFQDKRAYDEFINGAFEFESKASAVVVTAGVQAQAGTTGRTASANASHNTSKQHFSKYVKGMAVFVHSHGGLMAEASIGGQVFEFKPLAAK